MANEDVKLAATSIANDTNYRVRLRNSTLPREVVTFVATPELSESRSVNYDMVEPVHAPGQIAAYMRSTSRTFSLSNCMLISRTPEEAHENIKMLWILRSWTMPHFGQSTLTSQQQDLRETFGDEINEAQVINNTLVFPDGRTASVKGGIGVENLGRPPAVLLLSAYSRDSSVGEFAGGRNSKREHINRVPVVIQTLSINYPTEVDYIPSTQGVPMPTIMSVEMTLLETHSPSEYEKFNLSSFKRGVLTGF